MNKITSFLLVVFLSASCTPPNYDEIPLAPVKIDGKWGYIYKNVNKIIKPQFDLAWDFQEGLARIKVGDKWGYIDKSGKITIDPQFEEAGSFQEGLARISLGGKYGYIDK